MTQGPYTETMIRAMLKQDVEFLYKALLLLFERQTEDEQDVLKTKHRNHVGFSAADGGTLSKYAEQLQQNGKLGPLTMEDCRFRMLKYSKQLLGFGDELL